MVRLRGLDLDNASQNSLLDHLGLYFSTFHTRKFMLSTRDYIWLFIELALGF